MKCLFLSPWKRFLLVLVSMIAVAFLLVTCGLAVRCAVMARCWCAFAGRVNWFRLMLVLAAGFLVDVRRVR